MLAELRVDMAGYACVIFVDSNVPMYLVGAPHPHKARRATVIEKLISDRQRLVTDAEVLKKSCTATLR